MRSVKGPQTGWAYAQFIDELAYAAKIDPVAFLRQNVTRENRADRPWFHDHRWLTIIDSSASAAKWEPRVAASRLSDAPIVTGRGIAVSTHSFTTSAVVVSIEVNKKTGKIVVKDIYVTQDTGLSINPALVENQMIGGVVMAASRVLHEQVTFNTKRVTSLDWVTYPIMRFKDSPRVHPIVVQHMDQIAGGSGEVPMDATVAAIGNAFFDATGVRIREAPLRPAKVRAALAAAGVKV
jgi:CO/xanthine dehydrogenase Mo-binding subunit